MRANPTIAANLARIGMGVLGIAGALCLAMDWRVLEEFEREGIAFLSYGRANALLILLAPVLAALVASGRSVARAALALGMILAGLRVVQFDWWAGEWRLAGAGMLVLSFVLAVIPLGASAREEPAALSLRVGATGVVVGALASGLVAASLFPRTYALYGLGDPVWPPVLLIVAAVFVVVAAHDLTRGRARALVLLAASVLALSFAPEARVHADHCTHSGFAASLFAVPAVFASFALLPWLGPLWRFLRRRPGPGSA